MFMSRKMFNAFSFLLTKQFLLKILNYVSQIYVLSGGFEREKSSISRFCSQQILSYNDNWRNFGNSPNILLFSQKKMRSNTTFNALWSSKKPKIWVKSLTSFVRKKWMKIFRCSNVSMISSDVMKISADRIYKTSSQFSRIRLL